MMYREFPCHGHDGGYKLSSLRSLLVLSQDDSFKWRTLTIAGISQVTLVLHTLRAQEYNICARRPWLNREAKSPPEGGLLVSSLSKVTGNLFTS